MSDVLSRMFLIVEKTNAKKKKNDFLNARAGKCLPLVVNHRRSQ